MNFLDAEVLGSGRVGLPGGVALDVSGSGADLATGHPVVLGVRPEHAVIELDGALELEVELAEPLGAETLIHGVLRPGDGTFTVRVNGEQRVTPGERIRLRVEQDKLHLFDHESGLRLS